MKLWAVARFLASKYVFVTALILVILTDASYTIFMLSGGLHNGYALWEDNPYFKQAVANGDRLFPLEYSITYALCIGAMFWLYDKHWGVRLVVWGFLLLRIYFFLPNHLLWLLS